MSGLRAPRRTHRGRRPVAGALALTLTSGTLAGLGLTVVGPARALATPSCTQASPAVSYAAGDQGAFAVPPGVHAVDVMAAGGRGGYDNFSGVPGSGASVGTTLAVSPGQSLDYSVATDGGSSAGGLSGTMPSGGNVSPWYDPSYVWGGAGGGATFVSSAGAVLVAAGGGGGAGIDPHGGEAGPGAPTATTGVFNGANGQTSDGTTPATGASSVPGTGAPGGAAGSPGNDGAGQVGGDSGANTGAGGGGGGFRGGGGGSFGSYSPNSGGAGSSYSVSGYTIVGGSGDGALALTTISVPVFQSAAADLFIKGQAGSFVVCAPGGLSGTISALDTLPAGVSFVDNHDGTATLSGTPTQAGVFPLTLTAGDTAGSQTQSFTLTVHDISPASLVVSAGAASVANGADLSVTVTALDAQGDVATTDNDSLSLSSTDALATLPGGVTLTAGTATFTAKLFTAGTQTVTALDHTVAGPTLTDTSQAVTVAPAAVSALTVSVPGSAVAGTAVTATITARDAYGNTATQDVDNLALTSSDPAVVVPGTTTLVAGVATAAVTFATAGSQTVRATDMGNAAITGLSPLVVVAAAAVSQLALTTPGNVTAGSANALTVVPMDRYGNVATTSDLVHFTSTDPAAVLPADTALDAASGLQVTFTTAGSQSLTATDVTNPAVTLDSVGVTVVAGAAQSVLSRAGDLQSARAGHDFGLPLSVTVRDAEGNPVAGHQVDFAVPQGAGSSFGGSPTDTVLTDDSGVAVSSPLTAGPVAGPLTVTASTSVGGSVDGSVAFTEAVTASDAQVLATPRTSSGIGTAVQSTTVSVPGGRVSLLDSLGDPVTTVVTGDGTFVLDSGTGVISFVAVAGFSGTAAPVGYQITDAYNLQASSTYTPSVTAPAPVAPPVSPPVAPPTPPGAAPRPSGVAHVVIAARVVLTGASVVATCTVSVPAVKSCRTELTAQVAGRQVVLGRSSTTKARTGASTVRTVIRLSALGRALAGQVGGVRLTVWASVVKADGRTLSAKRAALLVDHQVSVPAAVLFPVQATLTGAARRQLAALRSHLAGVVTVTCVGYTDSIDTSASNLALGRARAEAVCAGLAGHGRTIVVLTQGEAHPAAANSTTQGRALNRRVEIRLTY